MTPKLYNLYTFIKYLRLQGFQQAEFCRKVPIYNSVSRGSPATSKLAGIPSSYTLSSMPIKKKYTSIWSSFRNFVKTSITSGEPIAPKASPACNKKIS